MLCYGGHNRVVVGVLPKGGGRPSRLIMLDPKMKRPQLWLPSAEHLSDRARAFECLLIRPGIGSSLPMSPSKHCD